MYSAHIQYPDYISRLLTAIVGIPSCSRLSWLHLQTADNHCECTIRLKVLLITSPDCRQPLRVTVTLKVVVITSQDCWRSLRVYHHAQDYVHPPSFVVKCQRFALISGRESILVCWTDYLKQPANQSSQTFVKLTNLSQGLKLIYSPWILHFITHLLCSTPGHKVVTSWTALSLGVSGVFLYRPTGQTECPIRTCDGSFFLLVIN